MRSCYGKAYSEKDPKQSSSCVAASTRSRSHLFYRAVGKADRLLAIAIAAPTLEKIATVHKTGVAQVCLRWVLQRGAVMAIGTGSNATTIDSSSSPRFFP